MKYILDACCGGRMFWHNKHHPNVIYMDNREMETTLSNRQTLRVAPDVVADFRAMPFDDATFSLVVFDPPHLDKAGPTSWLAQKYGVLGEEWREDIRKGFAECFRVLKQHGTLVFKWSEAQIKLAEVLALTSEPPLFGDRSGRTHWVVFSKGVEMWPR